MSRRGPALAAVLLLMTCWLSCSRQKESPGLRGAKATARRVTYHFSPTRTPRPGDPTPFPDEPQ